MGVGGSWGWMWVKWRRRGCDEGGSCEPTSQKRDVGHPWWRLYRAGFDGGNPGLRGETWGTHGGGCTGRDSMGGNPRSQRRDLGHPWWWLYRAGFDGEDPGLKGETWGTHGGGCTGGIRWGEDPGLRGETWGTRGGGCPGQDSGAEVEVGWRVSGRLRCGCLRSAGCGSRLPSCSTRGVGGWGRWGS